MTGLKTRMRKTEAKGEQRAACFLPVQMQLCVCWRAVDSR